MAWISKILLFLIFLWLANFLRSLVVRAVGRALRPPAPNQRRRAETTPPVKTGKTVKDPNCGLHLAESLAIAAELDGHTLHFCSTKCRDAYLERGSGGREAQPVA